MERDEQPAQGGQTGQDAHLTEWDRDILDRCIAAITAGETEIEVGDAGVVSRLRSLDPDAVDTYAASKLPKAVWGKGLRLVWKRARVESSWVTFLEEPVQRHLDELAHAMLDHVLAHSDHGGWYEDYDGLHCAGDRELVCPSPDTVRHAVEGLPSWSLKPGKMQGQRPIFLILDEIDK